MMTLINLQQPVRPIAKLAIVNPPRLVRLVIQDFIFLVLLALVWVRS